MTAAVIHRRDEVRSSIWPALLARKTVQLPDRRSGSIVEDFLRHEARRGNLSAGARACTAFDALMTVLECRLSDLSSKVTNECRMLSWNQPHCLARMQKRPANPVSGVDLGASP